MTRKSTPTYTIEFPLRIPLWQQHRLEKKFKIARTVYNSCLGEALKRHKAVKADKQYRTMLREPKSKQRDKQLADIRLASGFSEYRLHNFVKSVQRKMSHEKLANDILALGSDIRVETMRFQSLQKRAKYTTRSRKNGKMNCKKRFGKSIATHAPAMLLTIIDRKLGYQERSMKKIDTYSTKASQFNHVTGEYNKKQLSERWNDFGEFRIQRDLYSSFLIGNTNETLNSVDVDLCNAQWERFVELHNREIARLKQSSSKTLRWFVA